MLPGLSLLYSLWVLSLFIYKLPYFLNYKTGFFHACQNNPSKKSGSSHDGSRFLVSFWTTQLHYWLGNSFILDGDNLGLLVELLQYLKMIYTECSSDSWSCCDQCSELVSNYMCTLFQNDLHWVLPRPVFMWWPMLKPKNSETSICPRAPKIPYQRSRLRREDYETGESWWSHYWVSRGGCERAGVPTEVDGRVLTGMSPLLSQLR